jgi:hypothetical protein
MQFKSRHYKPKKKVPAAAKPPVIHVAGVLIENVIEPCRRPGLIPLSVREPELALEWYYPKNCGFGPEDFSYGSQVAAWWQCKLNKKHIWQVRILTRAVSKRGCPLCFGHDSDRRPIIKERSLAFICPDLIDEWHPTLNGYRTPYNVLAGSKKKAWWQCKRKKRHVWEAVIKARAYGSGCPDCYDERQLDIRKYPKQLALFDYKKNKFIDPAKTDFHTLIWWRCPKGPDHSWEQCFRPSLGCPFCRNKRCSVTNSLATLYPKIAKQLHPTRNGKITAATICAFSCRKVWWRCPIDPDHKWESTVNNRTKNESKCPDCWKLVRPKYFKRLAAERKARKVAS